MWTNFFMVAAGASATLAGLVFVALSVNIADFIQSPHLPPRASATIAMLILILLSSMVTLIHQPSQALGIEIFLFALYGLWRQIISARHGFAARTSLGRPLWESVLNAVLGQVQIWPFIIGAILLFFRRDYGLYWIAAGCIAIFLFSVLNSWVLLIEIRR